MARELRVGDKVRLTTGSPDRGLGKASYGDEGKVVAVSESGIMKIDFPSHSGWNGYPSEVALVEEKGTEAKDVEASEVVRRLAQIERRLASIEELLAPGEYTEDVPKETPRKKEKRTPLSPNDLRKSAIQFAKGFTNAEEHAITSGYGYRYVEYQSNAAKGTVVALIKQKDRFYGRDLVEMRGIAKLSPGDTFNEHIGRAIALHRALGLTIPEELEYAPNPTAPVKGMRIHTKTSFGVLTLADETDPYEAMTLRADLFSDLDGGRMTIVDDTEALY